MRGFERPGKALWLPFIQPLRLGPEITRKAVKATRNQFKPVTEQTFSARNGFKIAEPSLRQTWMDALSDFTDLG